MELPTFRSTVGAWSLLMGFRAFCIRVCVFVCLLRCESRGSCVAKDAVVLAVYEDWAGGAGNALGTLYAYQKASALATTKGLDLPGKLAAGEVR